MDNPFDFEPRDALYDLGLTISHDTISGAHGSLPVKSDDSLLRDLLLLLLHEVGGMPLDDALRLCGYSSRATYYAKLKRFNEGGLAALLPRRPGPRSKWRRSDEVVQRVIALRHQKPQPSVNQIARALRSAGFEVSTRSIERTLSEHGLCRHRDDK